MGKRLSRRTLILVDILLVACLVGSIYAFTTRASAGASLNSKGSAYELNLDDTGRMWISDPQAGEVWSVDPSSAGYEIYPVGGSPVDAREAGGWAWWADGQSNLVGQVSAADGTFNEWRIPDALGFLGTAVDAAGRLYLTDSSNPSLYVLDPQKSELCTISLPGFGASNYIVNVSDTLWLGDWFDSTIVRFQPADNALTWWPLPPGSTPFGMAADSQGILWYADQENATLARFDPATSLLTAYTLPKGNLPQMIAIRAGMIWFTEQSLPGYGYLDPRVAESSSVTLAGQDQQVEPNCTAISPAATGKITITSGKMSWGNKRYPSLVKAAGWQIYRLPKGSDPWGIALEQYGYLVDSGHQSLLRFALPQELPSVAVSTGAPQPDITAQIDQPVISPPTTQPATAAPVPTQPVIQPPVATPLPTLVLEAKSSLTYLPSMIRDFRFGLVGGVIPPAPVQSPYPGP